MTYRIWFVPGNSSHVAKLKALMDAFRDRGDDVRILVIEEFQRPRLACLPQVKASGYPYVIIPGQGFPRDAHWILKALRRGWVRRCIMDVLPTLPADVLILGGDTGVPSRLVIREAHNLGIPTVTIPDGLVLPPNPLYQPGLWKRLKEDGRRLINKVLRAGGPRGTSKVDLLLVMNDLSRQALLSWGVSDKRIAVVGSPEYDDLARKLRTGGTREEIEEVRRRLGLPSNRPIVFFAHQPTLCDREGMQRLFCDMVEGTRRCGAMLLVKFHPRGPDFPDEWRQWAEGQGLRRDEIMFVREECTSIEAARLCTACVAVYSTVALEVLACHKPLVIIQYLDRPVRLELAGPYGAAIDAESPDQLKDAIVAVVTDDEVRARLLRGGAAAIEKELCGLDGKSADRMIEAVLRLIERRKSRAGNRSDSD